MNTEEFVDDLIPCFNMTLETIRRSLIRLIELPHTRRSFRAILRYMSAYRQCMNAMRLLSSVEDEVINPKYVNFQLTPQSNEENMGQTQYEQKLTTFVEDSPPHDGDNIEDPQFHEYPSPTMMVDLQNFIKRPYIVSKFSWTSAIKQGTEILNGTSALINFPDCFKDIMDCKFKWIQYWRPDFEIEVRVNGTNFHYGRLLFAVYPLDTCLDPIYKSYYNCSTWKWFQVNPSSHQTVKFKLPYVSHLKKQSLPANGGDATVKSARQLYTIRCYVTAPLSSAQQAAVAPVEVVVWARITNPRFSGYTYANPELAAQGEDINAKEGYLNVETPSFPPMLNIDLNAVDSIVGKIARVYMNGNSIPPSTQSIMSVQNKNIMPSRVDDTTNTRILGPSQKASIIRSPKLVNGVPNETNIVKFCSHPSLLYVGKITTNDVPDTIVYRIPITPSTFAYTDYNFTPQPGTYWPLPVSYVARLFKYWRGSMKFHFSFIASSFHSIKLRIAWVPKPGNVATYPTALTSVQTSNLLNAVVDINKQTEYSFIVPWDSNYDFLDVDNPQNGEYTNGCLYMQVINTLTSSFDTPQPIYFQVFVSCGEDLQFAVPRTSFVTLYGAPDFDDLAIKAQSADTLECELPSSSYSCLMKQKYQVIGGVNQAYRLTRIASSYEITDLKQLAVMLSPFEVTSLAVGVHSWEFRPLGTWSRPYNDPMWHCFLPHILALFRYVTGSFRVSVLPQETAFSTWFSTLNFDTERSDLTFWQNTTGVDTLTMGEGGYISLNGQSSTTDPVDLTIPYFSDVSCIPINSTKPIPGVYVPTMTVSVAARIAMYVTAFAGAGDDVMFGYQIGIPRCRNATGIRSNVKQHRLLVATPDACPDFTYLFMPPTELKNPGMYFKVQNAILTVAPRDDTIESYSYLDNSYILIKDRTKKIYEKIHSDDAILKWLKIVHKEITELYDSRLPSANYRKEIKAV